LKIETRKYKTHPFILSRYKKGGAKSYATFVLGDILVSIYAFAPNILHMNINDLKEKRGMSIDINKPKPKKPAKGSTKWVHITGEVKTGNVTRSTTLVSRKSKVSNTRTI
jgi:hypothetical protein